MCSRWIIVLCVCVCGGDSVGSECAAVGFLLCVGVCVCVFVCVCEDSLGE